MRFQNIMVTSNLWTIIQDAIITIEETNQCNECLMQVLMQVSIRILYPPPQGFDTFTLI
jgi:hypothetical protein